MAGMKEIEKPRDAETGKRITVPQKIVDAEGMRTAMERLGMNVGDANYRNAVSVMKKLSAITGVPPENIAETLKRNPERVTREGYTLKNAKSEYGKPERGGIETPKMDGWLGEMGVKIANQLLDRARRSHEEKADKFGKMVAITDEFRKMLRGEGVYRESDFQSGARTIDKKIGWSEKGL